MRFRRSFSRRGSIPREPVSWDRSNIGTSGTAVKDVVGAAVLFDPTAIVAGSQDLRLTIRRILLSLSSIFTVAGGTAAVGDAYEAGFGIYVNRVGESPLPNPLLPTAADQRADWLWLDTAPLLMTAAPPSNFSYIGMANLKNTPGLIDVKAMRKLDQDERLTLLATVRGTDIVNGHAPATITWNARSEASVLYSRTMRRRG